MSFIKILKFEEKDNLIILGKIIEEKFRKLFIKFKEIDYERFVNWTNMNLVTSR